MSSDIASMEKSYHLMIDDIKRRHPEMATPVFRWSKSHYYQYLVKQSYGAGNYRCAVRAAVQAFRCDGAALFTPWLLAAFLAAVTFVAVGFRKPIFSRVLQRKSRAHASRQPKQWSAEAKPETATNPQPVLWQSVVWYPYGLLCIWRWRRLLRRKS